jgi:transcriptional regulator with XRE-family HTH domain
MALARVARVLIPEPHHRVAPQVVAFGELVVGRGVEGRVGDRVEQQLERDVRSPTFPGQQRDRCCHVSSNAVASHGKALGVHSMLPTALGNPLHRRVALLEGRRVPGFGGETVLGEHDRGPGSDREFAHQPVMRLRAAEHPPGTMEVHDDGQRRQAMLTLRMAIGLTQAGLARHLGVSRKAVGEWEAGLTYPKTEYLKAFIALAAQQQAFPLGREAEEIRAFWHAAHQKVLLDEAWLGTLLPHAEVSPVPRPVEETIGTTSVLAPLARGGRVDWGDAPTVTTFFGREWEQTLLTSWIVEERCRVVSVLGLGGIGKSALATWVMHWVAEHFEVVVWRSLRDAPTCEALLEECLQSLAPQALRDVSGSLERRLGLLLEYLRNMRVLLVLDNLEALLEEGEGTGHMRAGYEGYARLTRRS